MQNNKIKELWALRNKILSISNNQVHVNEEKIQELTVFIIQYLEEKQVNFVAEQIPVFLNTVIQNTVRNFHLITSDYKEYLHTPLNNVIHTMVLYYLQQENGTIVKFAAENSFREGTFIGIYVNKEMLYAA